MRLHLIDGTYELFRAHFGKRPPRTSPMGQDVKATVGVVDRLLSLLASEDEPVTHIAVAYDNPIESFRNDLFAGYKSSAGVAPELLAQFDLVEEATRAVGVTTWSMREWEADDALASGAIRWADEVDQVRIMTPDKDLGQVVRGAQIVQVDDMRDRTFDEAGVAARLGVPPASVPDYLGLVGDTADGIPGLKGFGAKSTSLLLSRYGSIESIPADHEAWEVKVRGSEGLARTLNAERGNALFYRRLATLITDVPLSESLSDLEWSGVPRLRFEAWCDELGVGTLRDRPSRWADD